MKTYWIRKNPEGTYFRCPSLTRYSFDDPQLGLFTSYKAYERFLKKEGWKIVKVRLVEVKK